MTRVARYDRLGFLEDLPAFNVERWDHGCGAYLKEDGTQVKSEVLIKELLPQPYSILGQKKIGALYMSWFNVGSSKKSKLSDFSIVIF